MINLSYNALQVLEKRYLLKDNEGKVRESPEQMFRRVAKYISEVEKKYGKSKKYISELENEFYTLMTRLEFLPNTPTLMNAGTSLGTLAACYVLPVEDSIEGIFETLKIAAMLHHEAAGTGFSFSKIRPKGYLVKSSGGIASGPLSFIEVFDKMTEVMKAGGKRRGANMGVLRVDHPDIIDFIQAKNKKGMLENFNISVAVTDSFMKAVLQNKEYSLIDPAAKKAVKKINAKKVFDLIVKNAWKTGDPGLIFIDEINRTNPTNHIGEIEATNPCAEIPLHEWEACNLGSINIAKFVKDKKFDWESLKKIIPTCVRFLDNVIDASKYPVKEIEGNVKANRRIGLGVMGLADCLIKLRIPYTSKQALDFSEKIMKFIKEESHKASQELGEEKGNFPNFIGSQWQKKYKYMRNATVTTIAPTGTISIIAGCSSGIEPLFAVAYMRNIIDKHLLEVTPSFKEIAKEEGIYSESLIRSISKTGSIKKFKSIPKKIKELFVTALEINPEWHVRMQASFQKYIDNAVSKTINMPTNAPLNEVRKSYLLAWKLKCKGITVYRYGSKEKQVLTIDKNIIADQDFSGGCEGAVCPH